MAFYGGIKKEGGLISASFRKLVRHRGQLLQTQWLFSMWQVSCAAGRHSQQRSLACFLPRVHRGPFTYKETADQWLRLDATYWAHLRHHVLPQSRVS